MVGPARCGPRESEGQTSRTFLATQATRTATNTKRKNFFIAQKYTTSIANHKPSAGESRRWTGIAEVDGNPVPAGGHRTTAAAAGPGIAEVDGNPVPAGGHRTTAAAAGRATAEVDGNRTRRTGIARPTRFEGGGAHQALGHLQSRPYRHRRRTGNRGGGRESRACWRPPHDGGRCRTGIARPTRFEGGGAHQALGHLRSRPYRPRTAARGVGRFRRPGGRGRRCRRRGGAAWTSPAPRSGGSARG